MSGEAQVHASTHRLIASRYPTVGAFDDLTTDPDELVIAFLLESVTNDRLSLLSRRLPLLPADEIVQGSGATLVMAAFLHADEAGGRFTDGRLGAWYASFDVETAIVETVYHSTRRLRLSDGAFPSSIQMRQLVATIDCALVDIRGFGQRRPDLYDPDDYTAARAFGIALRWPKEGRRANGIVFDSVRHSGGTNVCVYRPSLVQLPVIQADHYEYRWNAAGEVSILKLTNIAAT
jgi:RES domain